METRANYVLIGAFTLIASIALLGFALWAAKYSSDRSWNEFDVVFREPVTGLTEGSSVQYNGNLPATRVSAYGADGQEDRAQRRYEFTLDLRGHAQGEQIAGMVNAALSGDPSGDHGPVKAGELTTLSFSEAQMRTLMERTQSMVGDNPMLGPSWQVLAEDGSGKPQQVKPSRCTSTGGPIWREN